MIITFILNCPDCIKSSKTSCQVIHFEPTFLFIYSFNALLYRCSDCEARPVGEARRGEARRGEAGGEARRGEARRGEARRGEAREARRGEARGGEGRGLLSSRLSPRLASQTILISLLPFESLRVKI